MAAMKIPTASMGRYIQHLLDSGIIPEIKVLYENVKYDGYWQGPRMDSMPTKDIRGLTLRHRHIQLVEQCQKVLDNWDDPQTARAMLKEICNVR